MQESLIPLSEVLIRQFAGEVSQKDDQVEIPVTGKVWERESCEKFNQYMKNYKETLNLKWLQVSVEKFLEIKIGDNMLAILTNRDLAKAMSSLAEQLKIEMEKLTNQLVEKAEIINIATWNAYIKTLKARQEVYSKVEKYESIHTLMEAKNKLKKFSGSHPYITVGLSGLTIGLISGSVAGFFQQPVNRIVYYRLGGGAIGMLITNFCIKGCAKEWAAQVENLKKLEQEVLKNARCCTSIEEEENRLKKIDESIKLNSTEVDQLFLEAQSASLKKAHLPIKKHIKGNKLSIDYVSESGNTLLDKALLIVHPQKRRNMVAELVKLGACKTMNLPVVLDLCRNYINEVNDEDSVLKEKVLFLQNLVPEVLVKPESITCSNSNDECFFKQNTTFGLDLDVVGFHQQCAVELKKRDDHITLYIQSKKGYESKEEVNWSNIIKNFIVESYSSQEKQAYLKNVVIVDGNRVQIYPMLKRYEIGIIDFLERNYITLQPSFPLVIN